MKKFKRLLTASLSLLVCTSLLGFQAQARDMPVDVAPEIHVQFPDQFSKQVQQRYRQHLRHLAPVRHWAGQNCAAMLCIRFTEQDLQNSESYRIDVRSSSPAQRSVNIQGSERGLLYGAYDLLEQLGFRFWHPFEVYLPTAYTPPELQARQEVPALKARGVDHHTMHPLELTHVLNAWGPQGPQDEVGFEASLEEYNLFLEWLIANRQNKFEWVLLEKADWGDFSRSPVRQQRLKKLVSLAHEWQLRVGIDGPLALEQQNGWRLMRNPQAKDALQELEKSLDWLAATDVDFFTTEMGLSEFHNSGAQNMLNWLNHTAEYLDQKYQLPFYTKIHISSGQFTDDFVHPDTGKPLNFNFLPYYGDPRIGLMPHTVQIYSLDDPAPTYGRHNFSEMRRFMQLNSGKRKMMWFPETAYWVNYDINIPLFLPVYAQRRLHDLRLLAADCVELEGQMLFSSGWEWGYWLNDVVAGRATWEQETQDLKLSEAQHFHRILSEIFAPYGPAQSELVTLLNEVVADQHKLLVLGEFDGKQPENIVKNTGMAYLAGQDTWNQMAQWIEKLGLEGFETQPQAYTLQQVQNDAGQARAFREHAYGLLVAMERKFKQHARRADSLQKRVPADLRRHFSEFHDGLWINAHRATQVRALYEAVLERQVGNAAGTQRWLKRAHEAITAAQQIVHQRSQNYRSDLQRLTQWQRNPTAYHYGYLYQAQNLFFWKRDWMQVAQNDYAPCYQNIIDPLMIGIPDPDTDWRAKLARGLSPLLGLKDCTAPRPALWGDFEAAGAELSGVTPTTDSH